jgi:ABC-type multidrug transport system permease subunit
MYHPFAEAIASMLCDMPYKTLNAITFNIPLYFMTNLRQEAGAFFVFLLFSFVTTLTMSMLFRTMASWSRTLSQALVPAAILILGLVIYTGFTIPTRNMLGWSRWMNYINPIGYGFESLMVNEFEGRTFPCSDNEWIPRGEGYLTVERVNQVCAVVGAAAGSGTVDGTTFLRESYQYTPNHKWRNLGIMFAFMAFFLFTYLFGVEFISEAKSKGEVLLFRRGQAPPDAGDEETRSAVTAGEKVDQSTQDVANIQRQTAIFHWKDVCYDIKIKNEPRRILDHVDGWVKPGTCTALMVSLFLILQWYLSNVIRVFLVLVKPHFWMYLLLV